jgi:hypothetical protein
MPTVALLGPPGVAQVGARGEPNPLAVVDSALLFRVSSSPASALVLDQSVSSTSRAKIEPLACAGFSQEIVSPAL